jgi:hypothetical protein
MIISVAGTPRKPVGNLEKIHDAWPYKLLQINNAKQLPNSPTDAATDASTIPTPATPRAIWLSIFKMKQNNIFSKLRRKNWGNKSHF